MGMSPLPGLDKQELALRESIESLNDLIPAKGSMLWAKVQILKRRLEFTLNGTGYSGAYCHVSDDDATDHLIELGFTGLAA